MNKINRREFLGTNIKLLGLSALTSSIPFLFSCEMHTELAQPVLGIRIDIDLKEDEELSKLRIGWGILRRYPRVNNGIHIIIVRVEAERYTCFSSLCTHDSCFGSHLFVQPRRSIIACECHGSEFDAANHGKVLKGPAEKPLKEFPVEFNPETKVISIFF